MTPHPRNSGGKGYWAVFGRSPVGRESSATITASRKFEEPLPFASLSFDTLWMLLSSQPEDVLPSPALHRAIAAVVAGQKAIYFGLGAGQPAGWSHGFAVTTREQTDRQTDSSGSSAKCALPPPLFRTWLLAREKERTGSNLTRSAAKTYPPLDAVRARERAYTDPRTPSNLSTRYTCHKQQGRHNRLPSTARAPPSLPSFLCTAADMEEHPGCRYNMSSSKECSSTNGNFTCETIRRVFRNCPGVRPEQVYDITTKDSGTVAGSSKSPHVDGGGGGGDGGGSANERKMPTRDRVSLRGCC